MYICSGSLTVLCRFTYRTKKRYAQLANGNVRNFYGKQGKRNGSRILRGLIAISAYQGNSHDLHSKK